MHAVIGLDKSPQLDFGVFKSLGTFEVQLSFLVGLSVFKYTFPSHVFCFYKFLRDCNDLHVISYYLSEFSILKFHIFFYHMLKVILCVCVHLLLFSDCNLLARNN